MRGYFQRLTPEQRSELARKGGHASPNKWTSEQARIVGAKGGKAPRRRKVKGIVNERARQVLTERFWT